MLLAATPDDPFYATSIGIRETLKAATAPAHRALDECLGQFDLTTIAHYRRFLQASAAALLPLEQALERAGVAGMVDDWAERRRSEAIRADVAALHGSIAPVALSMPALDRPSVLGALYVLEGSRLGASYLLRVVAASADPRARGATRYLRHGAGKGLWRSFLGQLAQEPVTSSNQVRMIASAREVFAVFAMAMASA